MFNKKGLMSDAHQAFAFFGLGRLRCFSCLLGDLATQQTSAHAQFVFACLEKESVKTTTMFNRAQSCCGNAQAETLAKSIGNQSNAAKIWQKAALGSVIGVADVVACLDALAGQFAYTGHGYTYSCVCLLNQLPGKNRKAIQLAMIGKLRFYSQVGRRSQAAQWL